MISLLAAFIGALPELIKLVRKIQSEKKSDAKVKEDIKKINEAFEKRDASILNDIFKL